MLDFILIQHENGINLLHYRQEHTIIDQDHADIFSGFLSAIQNISEELNIGTLVLLSTEGTNGHNCVIVRKKPINVIMLMDQEDPIKLWRTQGELIAERFLESYGTDFNPNQTKVFENFKDIIKELCLDNEFCT